MITEKNHKLLTSPLFVTDCTKKGLASMYLMESIKRKIKKEDIYVLLFDESLIQQLKKKTAGHPSYTRIKL